MVLGVSEASMLSAAVGNADASMSIWDIADPGEPVLMSSITGPMTRVYGMDIDATADRLVAAVGDNTAWVWDTTDLGCPVLNLRLSLPETGLYTGMFSPDGERSVAAGSDGRVFVWTLGTDLALLVNLRAVRRVLRARVICSFT